MDMALLKMPWYKNAKREYDITEAADEREKGRLAETRRTGENAKREMERVMSGVARRQAREQVERDKKARNQAISPGDNDNRLEISSGEGDNENPLDICCGQVFASLLLFTQRYRFIANLIEWLKGPFHF